MLGIKAFIFLLASFIFTGNLFAQINNVDKNDYLDADYYFYIHEYEKVLEHLNEIHSKYPTHGNINYLIGVCHILLDDNNHQALQYLKTAVADINDDYRPGDLKNSGAPPDALLYYGDALHSTKSYIEASEAYHKYLSKVSEDELLRDLAINRIVGLGLSYEAHFHPPNLKVYELGASFNTSDNEINPVFSADNEVMLYTSSKGTSNRIMYTTKINGEWATPVDITRELGSDGSYYTSSLSHDGSRLFLIKDDKTNKDIYISNYENGLWTRVHALDKKINSVYNETGASISKDGNTLYFSSDKPGGYGGTDIYYSAMEKGKWSKPINIEAPINTSFDDDKPLISISDDTLFYSTNGRETIGKMDIFLAVKGDEGQWGKLSNIGVPYNTSHNDYLGCYLTPEGNTYLSQRKPDGQNGFDLYHIEKIDLPPAEIAENIEEGMSHTKEDIATNKLSTEIDTGALPLDPEENLIEEFEEVSEAYLVAEEISSEETNLDSEERTENVEELPIDEPLDNSANEGALVNKFVQNDEEQDILNDETVEDLKTDFQDIDTQDEKQPEIQSYYEVEDKKQNSNNVQTIYNPVETVQKEEIEFNQDANYTIQLMALREHSRAVEFKGLDKSMIKISIGSDGFSRYTYGQFETVFRAQQELLRIYKLGHVNAFIKDIGLISNY